MLVQVHNDSQAIENMITNKCGKKFSIIERIIKNNYGTSRYILNDLHPKKSDLDLDNFQDNIFLNFDLRSKGIK